MQLTREVEFLEGSDVLESKLREYAKITGGVVVIKKGKIRLRMGDLLALNPNALRFTVFFDLENQKLKMVAKIFAPPLLSQKFQRIVSFRLDELANFLEGKIKPQPEPYAFCPLNLASILSSTGYFALASILCLLICFIFTTALSIIILNHEIDTLTQKNSYLSNLGLTVLPSVNELKKAGFLFRLNCAILFSIPVALFVGLFVWVFLALGEIFTWLSRITMWLLLFFVLIFVFSFFKTAGPVLTILFAFAIPLFTYYGYSILWLSRKEVSKERPAPLFIRLLKILPLLVAILLFILVFIPFPREYAEDIVLFRDRFLLKHPVGKSVAEFYYKHTLYAAYLLKPMYSSRTIKYPDGKERPEPQRQLRHAVIMRDTKLLGKTREIELLLRRAGFLVFNVRNKKRWEEILSKEYFDVYFAGNKEALDLCQKYGRLGRTVCYFAVNRKDVLSIGEKFKIDDIKKVLDNISQRHFKNENLREISRLGWFTIYFALPFYVMFLIVAIFSVILSLLYKILPRIIGIVLICVVFAGLLLIFVIAGYCFIFKQKSFEECLKCLKSPSPDIRYEALYNICKHLERDRSLAKRLDSEILDRLLKDNDVRVRMWASACVGEAGFRKFGKALIDMLKDPEIFVRYKVCEALGKLRMGRAHLGQVIGNDWWYVGAYAYDALK